MSQLTRTRTIIMAMGIGGAYFTWGLLLSVPPVIYPPEAEKRGLLPSQYGFSFGIVDLTALLSSPFFATYGETIGPKLLYTAGGFIQGVSGLAKACMAYVDNSYAFLTISYVAGAFDGAADAAAWVAVIAILMQLYPDKVATILSWTEMVFGLGYAVGPVFGFTLMSIGGFQVPFFSIGAMGIFFALFLVLAIPDVKKKLDDNEKSDKGHSQNTDTDQREILSIITILKSPKLLIPYADNMVCFAGFGMVEAMSEPHLRKTVGASEEQVMLFFLIIGVNYAIVTITCGYFCDRIKYPVLFSISGNFLMAGAVSLVGPLPGLAFTPTPHFMLCLAAVIGFSYPQIMVSTFARAFNSALKEGYADSIGTYLAISGMWSTSFYLGDFIGMTGGGILVTYLGYSKMSAFYVVAYVVFCFVDLFELSSTIQEDKERQLKREEREEQEKDKGSSKSNKPAVSEKLPEILKPGSLNPDEIAFGSHSETREAANVVSMYAIDADTDSVKSSSSEDSESVRSDATLPSGKRLASQELAANDSKNDAKEGT